MSAPLLSLSHHTYDSKNQPRDGHGQAPLRPPRRLRRPPRARRAVPRRRPRHAPGHLRRGPCIHGEGERIPVQGEHDGRRLLLHRAEEPREHVQRHGVAGDRGQRGEAPRAEHPGRVHGPHRLRRGRHQPTPHPPPRHGDHLRPRGQPRRRLHHDGQQALRQDHHQGRGVRLPPGARALPEEQRALPRRRHRRLQQPAAGHAVDCDDAVRRHAASADRRAGEGLPGQRRGGGGHQVQVRAQVGHTYLRLRYISS